MIANVFACVALAVVVILSWLLLLQERRYFRDALMRSEDSYSELMTRTLERERDIREAEALNAQMKEFFQIMSSRPVMVSMSDQQVMQLGTTVGEMVKASLKTSPGDMN